MAASNASFTFKTANLEAKIRRRLRETPLAERQIMHQIAVFIEREAKRRAPVDIGTLTGDIRSMVVESTKGVAAVVYVPVNSPSSQYAVAMHEGDYKLGPNSLERQRKEGVIVGFFTVVMTHTTQRPGKIFRQTTENPAIPAYYPKIRRGCDCQGDDAAI